MIVTYPRFNDYFQLPPQLYPVAAAAPTLREVLNYLVKILSVISALPIIGAFFLLIFAPQWYPILTLLLFATIVRVLGILDFHYILRSTETPPKYNFLSVIIQLLATMLNLIYAVFLLQLIIASGNTAGPLAYVLTAEPFLYIICSFMTIFLICCDSTKNEMQPGYASVRLDEISYSPEGIVQSYGLKVVDNKPEVATTWYQSDRAVW